MEKRQTSVNEQSAVNKNEKRSPAFLIMVVVMLAVVSLSLLFLSRYKPSPTSEKPQITFKQKMAYLESGTPFPQEDTRPVIPWWMMAIIFSFIVIQILPLLIASHKARSKEFTRQELRTIEFLAETPLHLGLLGSLLGVCLTQFLSGTLSAPLAYFTTISGILLYLLGRFTILVSLPAANDLS